MNNNKLIEKAASVVKTKVTKAGMMGDVGCALLTKSGNLYMGICASVGSSNFCAEQAAIGEMITKGEFDIDKIVAVWKNEEQEVFVIPPCGKCRQMMRDINEENISNTKVLIDDGVEVFLKDLIPYYDSWRKIYN